MRIRLDQRKPARDRLAALDKGLLARRVQHDDAGLQRQRSELAGVVADPQSFDRNVDVAAERGIDRYEIILAGELHSVTGEIDHRDRARTGGLGLLDEVAKTLAQRIGVEVTGPDHVEARRLQGLRDQAGIVGRRRERRLGVSAVADDERDPLFLLLRRSGTEQSPEARKTGTGTAKKSKRLWSYACFPAAHDLPEHRRIGRADYLNIV